MPRTAKPLEERVRGRLDEDRLAELLDIAAEVFITKGFEAASTNEIAKRSNSSKGTFYSRFPTKEDLFLEPGGHDLHFATKDGSPYPDGTS
ncbi:MAG TPA: helix-turn-helix domain-containing protein [Edaphobacter sp.]|nr:helix-turn-helix domain-containing protein [Edaphobacter sp.]